MRFNIRVYGILLNEKNEVLLSDERRFGTSFTKFPGGGLEWGEGIKDALIRELQEELNIDAEIGDLLYVNDFFQQSAFRESDQIISFYFKVNYPNFQEIDTRTFEEKRFLEGESFRWVNLTSDLPEKLTFPIDKEVARLLTSF